MILQTSLSLFSKELTDGESNYWLMVMDEWTVPEMRYAFDNWNRNGRYFPKPKDIIEQIEAFRLSKSRYGNPACDDLCRSRHGRGYGKEDIIWLMDRYLAKRKAIGNRTLKDGEVNNLLDELDNKRGEAPAWRQSDEAQ